MNYSNLPILRNNENSGDYRLSVYGSPNSGVPEPADTAIAKVKTKRKGY